VLETILINLWVMLLLGAYFFFIYYLIRLGRRTIENQKAHVATLSSEQKNAYDQNQYLGLIVMLLGLILFRIL